MTITFTVGEFATLCGTVLGAMVTIVTMLVSFLSNKIDRARSDIGTEVATLRSDLHNLRDDTSNKRHDMYETIHKFQNHCSEDVDKLRTSMEASLAEIRRQLAMKGPAR